MKPVDVKSNTYIDSSKKLMITIQSIKFVIMLEYQNMKIFLQQVILQIRQKKFLWLKKSKMLCCGHMLLMIIKGEKLLEGFTETSYKKQTKKSLELRNL